MRKLTILAWGLGHLASGWGLGCARPSGGRVASMDAQASADWVSTPERERAVPDTVPSEMAPDADPARPGCPERGCPEGDDPCVTVACIDGVCQGVPAANDCGARVCGASPNGCHSCGACSEGLACQDGACVGCLLAACGDCEVCEAGRCLPLPNDCGATECGPSPSGCYECGACLADSDSCTMDVCTKGQCDHPVLLDCGSQACGPSPSGCVASCGTCAVGAACTAEGSCSPISTAPWSRSLGGIAADATTGVAARADGAVAVVGQLGGSVPYDLGLGVSPGDWIWGFFFVALYDDDGTPVWAQTFLAAYYGPSGTAGLHVVADSPGGVIVAGNAVTSDLDLGQGPLCPEEGACGGLFVARYTAEGLLDWSDDVGPTSVGPWVAEAITLDGQDGVVLAGSAKQAVSLTRVSSMGKALWVREYPATGTQVVSLGATTQGHFLILGEVGAKKAGSDGGVDFGGGALGAGVVLAEVTGEGEHVWGETVVQHESYFCPAPEAAGLALDPSGDLIVVGGFMGACQVGGALHTSVPLEGLPSRDVFVARLDPQGTLAWAKSFGAGGADHARSVAIDGAGRIVVGGDFEGTIDFGLGPLVGQGKRDIFVLILDADGEVLWSTPYGGGDDDLVTAVAVDPALNVLLGGAFRRSVDEDQPAELDFGQGPLPWVPSTTTWPWSVDGFVAKLTPYGCGPCPVGQVCGADGLCACKPDCAGKACGDDGCGGHCGECPAGQACGGGGASFQCSAPAGGLVWKRLLGGIGRDTAGALAVGADGRVVVGGSFETSVDPGTGPLTNAAWGRDIFLASYSADGAPLWGKGFEASIGHAFVDALAIDGKGDVVVAGRAFGGIDLGGGFVGGSYDDANSFLVKLDTEGAFIWQQETFELAPDDPVALAVHADDTIFLLRRDGVSLGAYDEAGVQLWTVLGSDLPGNATALQVAGDLVVVGVAGPLQKSGYYYKAKHTVLAFDAHSGAPLWAVDAGGGGGRWHHPSRTESSLAVRANAEGLQILETHDPHGIDGAGAEMGIRAIEASGAAFLFQPTSPDCDWAPGCALLEGPRVAAGGGGVAWVGLLAGRLDLGAAGTVESAGALPLSYEGPPRNSQPRSLLVARFGQALQPTYARVFATTNAHQDLPAVRPLVPTDVAMDPTGRIYVFGEVAGEVDFGDGPVTTAPGWTDVFLLTLQ